MTTQTIFKTAGSTSQSVDLSLVQNAASTAAGDPILGLAFNTSGIQAFYRINGTGTLTSITLATQTVTGAYSSGGFVQISSTNAPGQYRFDIPNAVLATAGYAAITFSGTPAGTAGNMETHTVHIVATGMNFYDATRAGLTSLSSSPPIPRYIGTAQTGAASTITLANGTSSLQAGVGDEIVLTGGTGAGQSGIVGSTSGMGGSTPVATMVQSWLSASPDGTTTYEILKIGQLVPAQPSDVWAVSTRTVSGATNITIDGTSAARESTIGVPATGTVSGAIAAVSTTLGSPAGGSVAAAVAAVKAVLPTALSTAGNMKSNVLEVNNSAGLAGSGVVGDNWRPVGAPPG